MTAPGTTAGTGAEGVAAWFWIELREPGKAPLRKGKFRCADVVVTLREFLAARPDALMTVVTVGEDGPDFEDATEVLERLDGRSRPIAKRHRATSRAAFLRHALASPSAPPDRAGDAPTVEGED